MKNVTVIEIYSLYANNLLDVHAYAHIHVNTQTHT